MDQFAELWEAFLANEYVQEAIFFAHQQWQEHPVHIVIEAVFILLLGYFLMVPVHKAKKPRVDLPTKSEMQLLINEHNSSKFSDLSAVASRDSTWDCGNQMTALSVHSYKDYFAFVKGGPHFRQVSRALNLATFDMYSLSTHPTVIESAKQTVKAYGVGSCGPRGFYGSVKPHIDCEVDLARFLGTQNCIIYSFAPATTSTLIPCFSTKGDYILVDDAVNNVVQQGASLSRSNVQYFPHNNMERLEEAMKAIAEEEEGKSQKKLGRRAVVTEGLFRNTGDIANLPAIVELCQKYKFRIYLDDSYGFGVLGATGRGTPEFYGLSLKHIDIYIGSMSNALGAVGGFCAGTNMVVEHQRLAATGYVFSASLPPYVTVACSKALEIIEQEPERVRRLQSNSQLFRSSIRKLIPTTIEMVPCAQDSSPIVHFRPKSEQLLSDFGAADRRFNDVIVEMHRHKHLVLRSIYNNAEVVHTYPSLRVVMKANMSEEEVLSAAKLLATALKMAFAR